MRRRQFIAVLGSAAAWPVVGLAQQSAVPVIGFLHPASPDLVADRLRAFRQGLSETGYVEGRNVSIEYRWADGQYDRLLALANELVMGRVAAIVAMSNFAARTAKAATTTIPIIFSIGEAPVQYGLVTSLNRPGGNVTGVSNLTAEVLPKRLELLRRVVPAAPIIAALVNPTNPNAESLSRNLQAAAHTLGLQLRVLHASNERDIDTVFATLVQLRAGGLVIAGDPVFTSRLEQLATLTVRHAVPAIHQYREFAAAGGLMSYGASLTNSYRIAGAYTGRILNGEKPSDLAVQQETRIELVINLKSAKALGLTIPETLLATADEVIE